MLNKLKHWFYINADHIVGKLIFFSLMSFVYYFSEYYVYMLIFFITQKPVVWLFYLAVMNLKRNRHLVTDNNKAVAYMIVGVGYVMDVLYCMTYGTLMFKELPRETLMTSKIYRHLHNGKITIEDKMAKDFTVDYLNGFDPNPWHVNLTDSDEALKQ